MCGEVISTSKPIKEVARARGVGAETLRNWLNKYWEANGRTETQLSVSERARLIELERQNQELRAETTFLKKSALDYRAAAAAAAVSEYEYLDSPSGEPTTQDPILKMGRWLGVATSSFFCH